MLEMSWDSATHQVVIQNRENLEMTGVSDLASFDDNAVVAVTAMGDVTVRGRNLNVRHLDLESGLLSISGKIEALTYSEPVQGGWLSRLLR